GTPENQSDAEPAPKGGNRTDSEYVAAALGSLESLIQACRDLDAADGAEHRDPAVLQTLRNALKRRTQEAAAYTSQRLDDLAALHLHSPPGEWASRLLDLLFNYELARGLAEHIDALRDRRYKLGKLIVLLKNDAAGGDHTEDANNTNQDEPVIQDLKAAA